MLLDTENKNSIFLYKTINNFRVTFTCFLNTRNKLLHELWVRSFLPVISYLYFFLVVELILTSVSPDWDNVRKDHEIWWVDGCCSGRERSGRWWTTGLERVPTTRVCYCANSSIFTGVNKVNRICNVVGTFVILDVTHDILYYYVCDWFN
jgi:hypothetical protein